MRIIKIVLGVSVLVFSLSTSHAYAQEQFTTKYDVNYTIQSNGDTNVNQNIQITNRLKDIIVKNYLLTIRQMKIHSVKATSNNEELDVELEEEEDQTTIKAILKNSTIGIDKKNDINIEYITPGIATKIGEVWNVNIPKVNLLGSTHNYDVTLVVPFEFGPEIFISPNPTVKIEETNSITYAFTKEQLENNGISGSFGKYQILNFKLDYELKNDSNFTETHEIALPPDMYKTQQVVYKSIEPKPEKMYLDEDKNVIAEYKLEGKEKLDIRVVGTTRILGQRITPKYGMRTKWIPKEIVSKYTKGNTYWNVDSPAIKKIAKELYDVDKTSAENALSAYLYVTNTLEYDFDILKSDVVERRGAENALESDLGNGCMEFADLFISITRAMGIPSRQLNGYAITNEADSRTPLSINLKGGDLLHSWAQFYDPAYGWVSVDPTWGHTSGVDYFTKLDTNHFVLSINGSDPNHPLPAGAYKLDETKKQVEVGFAQDISEFDFEPRISLYKAFNYNPFKLFQKMKRHHLKNEGLSTIYIKNDAILEPILPESSSPVYLERDAKTVLIRNAAGIEVEKIPSRKDEMLEKRRLFMLF